MQFTKVSNVIGASLLAGTLSLGAAVIPVQAQDPVITPEEPTDTQVITTDNDFDWGWLGLLGLIGLAGLAGNKSRNTSRTDTYTSDPTVTTNPDYRR